MSVLHSLVNPSLARFVCPRHPATSRWLCKLPYLRAPDSPFETRALLGVHPAGCMPTRLRTKPNAQVHTCVTCLCVLSLLPSTFDFLFHPFLSHFILTRLSSHFLLSFLPSIFYSSFLVVSFFFSLCSTSVFSINSSLVFFSLNLTLFPPPFTPLSYLGRLSLLRHNCLLQLPLFYILRARPLGPMNSPFPPLSLFLCFAPMQLAIVSSLSLTSNLNPGMFKGKASFALLEKGKHRKGSYLLRVLDWTNIAKYCIS